MRKKYGEGSWKRNSKWENESDQKQLLNLSQNEHEFLFLYITNFLLIYKSRGWGSWGVRSSTYDNKIECGGKFVFTNFP